MFKQVKVQQVHELVQESIEQAIGLGIYGPGDRLPQERELAEHMGVSRATVRQAMAVLETKGYVKGKRGSSGGWFVTKPRRPAGDIRTILGKSLPRLDSVLDFRIIVESAACELAAERANPADVRAMQDAIHEMEQAADVASFRRSDTQFHLAVAVAAHNSMLQSSIEDARATAFFLVDAMDFEVQLHQSSLIEHREIYHAINGHNVTAARQAMASHIETTRRELHTAFQEKEAPPVTL